MMPTAPAAVGGAYYSDPAYYGQQPPMSAPVMHVSQPGMHVSPEQMEEEANSWIMDPTGGDGGDFGGSPGGKRKRPRGSRPAAAEAEAPESDPMSNKTLELMLSRLQGQLPPQTYEKVIALVRDVQMRRMSLSRSEFLQHFQAICAGAPKPR